MIRAILDGRKTQTRRLVKIQLPDNYKFIGFVTDFTDRKKINWAGWGNDAELPCRLYYQKPPYLPDQILYVRETFCPNYFDDGKPAYRADWNLDFGDVCPEPNWIPSIHMPKELARIRLKVTNVSVERLQAMSLTDALAEGAENLETFKSLWNDFYKENSWDSNPWVWKIEFKEYK